MSLSELAAFLDRRRAGRAGPEPPAGAMALSSAWDPNVTRQESPTGAWMGTWKCYEALEELRGSIWPSLTHTASLGLLLSSVLPQLERELATHSSVLVWRIPWTEEPGRLLTMGSHRVVHN